MVYKRKTRDVFEIQGDYGNGWETVCAEETLSDAKKQLRCYDENETNYPHRIKRCRVKITEEGSA